jgi:hypothetical protein
LLRNQVRTADPTAQRTLQKPGPPSGPYI